MAGDSFRDFVIDQLDGMEGISCRPMFGGYGLYRGNTIFGIIYRGRLYFKTDASSAGTYIDRKMKPFRPSAKQTLKSYYEVPEEVLEDPDEIIRWAGKAIQCRRK